jgi:hypothetical protein
MRKITIMATGSVKALRRQPPAWATGEPLVLEIPPEAHTYAGFLDWVFSGALPEKLRVTFLAGRVSVDMTEESVDCHGEVKTGIYRTLLPLLAKMDFGRIYTDGMLLCNAQARIANNPDGIAFRWETAEAGRVRFVTRKGRRRAVEGSPDWVLEIVSDSSAKKDTRQLREAYHRAGIKEYWLIDARGDAIDFQILCWGPGGYVASSAKGGWHKSACFGRSFKLTRTQNRIGIFTYELRAKRPDSKTKARP